MRTWRLRHGKVISDVVEPITLNLNQVWQIGAHKYRKSGLAYEMGLSPDDVSQIRAICNQIGLEKSQWEEEIIRAVNKEMEEYGKVS